MMAIRFNLKQDILCTIMSWRAMRESGYRIMFTGVFSLAIAFVIYSRLSGTSGDAPVQASQLTDLAYAILGVTAASLAAAMYGAHTIFRAEQARAAASGGGSLMSFITGAFSDGRYWRIMAISAVGYGIFFAFLSQILVYRPDVSFSERGIAVPSTDLIPCCGAPGYMPMFTAYFTDHFLLLVIPVNVILAAVVSVMVGFNVALSVYAYRLRQAVQGKTSIVGGIGAATGLFVGCPTCAGSMISAVLGLGAIGAGASTSALAPFQTVFIAASLPALALAPFLLARSIRSISMCGAK
ncbi:hypothetical protein NTE_00822 [Candidatus Nitrososphaera evergladensis SR1]|uniref:Uncharacterized protein n=1 Tax=Candidatus Nitrososphaera evergladensis SR1 TaxID=1459636 RepID=A0A075MP14_9ARCH|nr:hypothetical protein NTE_00822 [Candidatus Nitrososphaera evergladensis SR1]